MIMSAACSLDLVPPTAGRKISSHMSSSRRSVGQSIARKRLLNACAEQNASTVLHRHSQEHLRYVCCTFLDENNVVLAADEQGDIDIIRIPRDWRSDGVVGEPLSLGVHVKPKPMAHWVDPWPNPVCKFKSLQNGKAFVTGLFNGELRIFDTEYGDSTYSKWVSRKTSTLCSRSSQDFIANAWKVRGPMRRYRYDCSYPLSKQIRSPHCTSNLRTILDWRDLDSALSDPQRFSEIGCDAQWDFYETSSSLMALHAQQDFFCLRILDDRTRQDLNNIFIDKEVSDVNETQEIMATCFVSDTAVATALGNIHDTRSIIKLWDIRMVKKNNHTSTILLPSFPRDDVHAVEATKALYPSKYFHGKKNTLHCRTWGDSKQVKQLSQCQNGRLLATLRTDRNSVEHYVIDPAREEIVDVVQQKNLFINPCLYALDGVGETMAYYEEQTGAAPTISIHDFSRGEDAGRKKSRGHKRTHSGSLATSNGDVSFACNLRDRYDLETQLSCMSLNATGTRIIAGSQDGDLFLWAAK